MRIAQIAPMYESVPPSHYGGIERVVWCLCEELVRRGHDVTLFASGDSRTSARLEATTPVALRRHLTREAMIELAADCHRAALGAIYRRAAEFDLMHSHLEQLTLPFVALVGTPSLLTMHSPLNPRYWRPVMRLYPDVPLAFISRAQMASLDGEAIHRAGCVPNGIPLDHFIFGDRPGDYLAYLGRIAPEKRPDRAVEVARRTGLPLKVGAKVDPIDQPYWESEIKPLFRDNAVEYLGEVTEEEKADLLRGALATLFPVEWPEPFGLVMPESLACGTPVIAMNRGSVPEIVHHGITGFVCNSVGEMVEAVSRVPALDRCACREAAARFSSTAMADVYERVYEAVLSQAATGLPLGMPVESRPLALDDVQSIGPKG